MTPRLFAALSLVLYLAGCAAVSDAPDAPRRAAVSWETLPGWSEDRHAAAVPAFLRGCEKMRGEEWRAACAAAARLPPADDGAARRFFERYFLPHQLLNEDGGAEGLITGYYEPLLRGAASPSARYQYPIYGRPADLLTVSLGALYPELENRRARGRVQSGEVVPYYSRAEIDGGGAPLAGEELLWVDDKFALFFLHIQGSGLVRLPDGRIVGVGYRDQNGHPYRSIGRLLAERGEMPLAAINLFSIREWLENNPARADALLRENPSYIFFTRRDEVGIGPRGALGVALTPERSLAADFSVVPRGAPVWLDAPLAGRRRAAAAADVRARFGRRDKGRRPRRLFLGARRARRKNGGSDEIARTAIRPAAAISIALRRKNSRFPRPGHSERTERSDKSAKRAKPESSVFFTRETLQRERRWIPAFAGMTSREFGGAAGIFTSRAAIYCGTRGKI